MKIRSAAVVAVVSIAACAEAPTAPARDQVPVGSSFKGGVFFEAGSQGGGLFLGSGSFTEEGATTSTVEGDTTGRSGIMIGSGSSTEDSGETMSTVEGDSTGRNPWALGSGS